MLQRFTASVLILLVFMSIFLFFRFLVFLLVGEKVWLLRKKELRVADGCGGCVLSLVVLWLLFTPFCQLWWFLSDGGGEVGVSFSSHSFGAHGLSPPFSPFLVSSSPS